MGEGGTHVTAKLCPRCARFTAAGSPLCGDCTQADNRRRTAKAAAHGRTGRRWQQLRQLVIARDRRCTRCGSPDDLTVHVDPRLRGNHRVATTADCTALCRRCHGAVDAPRAHTR